MASLGRHYRPFPVRRQQAGERRDETAFTWPSHGCYMADPAAHSKAHPHDRYSVSDDRLAAFGGKNNG